VSQKKNDVCTDNNRYQLDISDPQQPAGFGAWTNTTSNLAYSRTKVTKLRRLDTDSGHWKPKEKDIAAADDECAKIAVPNLLEMDQMASPFVSTEFANPTEVGFDFDYGLYK